VTHEHAGEVPTGGVALDIGPGRGALIIYPDERYRGREIEISHIDEDRRVHTGVHDREAGSGLVLTAVFGSLAPGDYVVWCEADTGGPTVTVPDAGIAEVALA
jgi:hypothetical protein